MHAEAGDLEQVVGMLGLRPRIGLGGGAERRGFGVEPHTQIFFFAHAPFISFLVGVFEHACGLEVFLVAGTG